MLRKEGFDVGYYKIWRLMSRLGLQSRYSKRFKVTTDSKHNFNIADNMRPEVCLQALQMAYWRRKLNTGVMHHSDRGSQYPSGKYQKMIPSMSGKGGDWDNAPTERFFRTLKHYTSSLLSLENKERR